jgi:hypothetical protein
MAVDDVPMAGIERLCRCVPLKVDFQGGYSACAPARFRIEAERNQLVAKRGIVERRLRNLVPE